MSNKPDSNEIARLKEENQQLKDALLDCFYEVCGSPEGKYDHFCMSAYEEAQEILIKYGVIKPEQCYRP